MKISVGICTWNRSELLSRTLDSLTRLEIPDGVDWELLVVDNCSTDDTSAVLRSYRDELPLTPLYEERAGKTYALNRAIDAASGDYVVWTDDDVRVAPDWLAAYHEAFVRYPDAGFFGGEVVPDFEGTVPSWLTEGLAAIAGVYAVTRMSEGPVRLDDPHLPYGVNVAFHMDVQRRHRYDPALGRRGESLQCGSETDVIRRALNAGVEGRWWPKARVHHFIPEERQTVEYVRRYFRDHAQTPTHAEAERSRSFLGRPLWAWKEALLYELRYRWNRRRAGPEVWIRDLKHAASAQGRLGFRSSRT